MGLKNSSEILYVGTREVPRRWIRFRRNEGNENVYSREAPGAAGSFEMRRASNLKRYLVSRAARASHSTAREGMPSQPGLLYMYACLGTRLHRDFTRDFIHFKWIPRAKGRKPTGLPRTLASVCNLVTWRTFDGGVLSGSLIVNRDAERELLRECCSLCEWRTKGFGFSWILRGFVGWLERLFDAIRDFDV